MAESALHLDPDRTSQFFSDITIRRGPQELLARYFLAVERLLIERKLVLDFISFESLLEVNRTNRDTWLPLTPTFNVDYNVLDDATAYCIAARDSHDRIVATHASRLFPWGATSFHEEAEALRLFYNDPTTQAQPGETCIVTAPNARRMRGNVVYSGSTWYHPLVRGTGLTQLLSPLNRAYALSQWDVDIFTGLITQANMDRGLPRRTRHPNAEYGVHSRASTLGDLDYSIVWSLPDFIVAEAERVISQASDSAVSLDQRRA